MSHAVKTKPENAQRMCRNGCNRPAIKRRPVCKICHRKDVAANYRKHKAEHEKWRERNMPNS